MSMLPSNKIITLKELAMCSFQTKRATRMELSTPNTIPWKGWIFVIHQSFAKWSQLKLPRLRLQPQQRILSCSHLKYIREQANESQQLFHSHSFQFLWEAKSQENLAACEPSHLLSSSNHYLRKSYTLTSRLSDKYFLHAQSIEGAEEIKSLIELTTLHSYGHISHYSSSV